MAPPGIEPGLTQNRTPQCVVIPLDHGTRSMKIFPYFAYRSLLSCLVQLISRWWILRDYTGLSPRTRCVMCNDNKVVCAKQIIEGDLKRNIGKGEKTLWLWELTERESISHHSVHTYVDSFPRTTLSNISSLQFYVTPQTPVISNIILLRTSGHSPLYRWSS